MSDIIRRKLDTAKKQLQDMENQVNKPEPKIEKTTNTIPPIPEPVKGEARPTQDRVGYAIQPGPRMRKRWKEV